ncbi:MAG: hypothetical protein L0220_22360, partial [Acidobacteria bacterium]|nr:hypothetical protein [Acidobacteriota bacterium]
RFQRRINKICGLAPNGKPNVRVIWPADSREEVSMYVDDDGEKRARYCLYSHEYQCERVQESGLVGVETVTVDIVPQRWIVEEYNEQTDSYLHLFTVGFHDERCCNGSESISGQLCFGLYREPEDQDLERLQKLVKLREEYIRVKPDEPMSYGELQDYLSRIRAWTEQAQLAAKRRYKEAIISGLMPQAARLCSDDPTVQKWNKWHFMAGHNKSGTPKPN